MRSRALVLAGTTLLLGLVACGTEPGSTGGGSPSASPAETSTQLMYVALGDSTATDYGGAITDYPTLYGEIAADALGEQVVVQNEAVPGITSSDLLSFLRNPPFRDSIAEADIVTVQISVNDFRGANTAALDGGCAANGDLSCHTEALEGVKQNLDAIVDEVLSLWDPSETVIRFIDNFDPYPGNKPLERLGLPSDYSRTIRPIVEEWNAFTCDLAESNGISCVSLYEAFNGPRGDRSPFQAGFLLPDGAHLTDRGHEAVAEEVAELGFAPLA